MTRLGRQFSPELSTSTDGEMMDDTPPGLKTPLCSPAIQSICRARNAGSIRAENSTHPAGPVVFDRRMPPSILNAVHSENHKLGRFTPMHSDSRIPNGAQKKKLCDMLHHALVDIRMLAGSGHGEQASDLADAFHNLPHEIWCDFFSISFFRQAFLTPYVRKWSGGRDYLAMLDEIERLS